MKQMTRDEAIKIAACFRFSAPLVTKEQLQYWFIGQPNEFWGIKYDPELEGDYFVNTGFMSTQCTGYAEEIKSVLDGGVKIMGFSRENNPKARILEFCDGHDFAVVTGGFIVDPWIVNVEEGIFSPTGRRSKFGLKGQGVFDMNDPEDQKIISMIYGDKTKWEVKT